MISQLFSSPVFFVLYFISLLIAITIHEFSHALAADRLGDPTPRSQGRLTLNPLKHLDPIGTISMLLVGFGWGRPVEFDPYNLDKPRRDAAIISLAGPVSNILLAIAFSLVLKFFPQSLVISLLSYSIITINVSLAIFNLVPIGPLDGQKILSGILPRDLAYEFEAIMHRYGTLLLLLFIVPSFGGQTPIHSLISPIIGAILKLLV